MSGPTILIIGGSGTLGNFVVKNYLEGYFSPTPDRIRILSRNEHSQIRMQTRFDNEAIDFFLGDIADRDRIMRACRGVDLVYHFAAVKHVHKAEYDPSEAVRTNIRGTMNVIDACIANGVHKAIYTSTDKAVDPINVYGATKLTAERLWIQGNIGKHDTVFSAVRYGNVFGSQGSVVEVWDRCSEINAVPRLTDPEMTRFFIRPDDAAHLVIGAALTSTGGEVYVPKMKACSLGQLCRVFGFDEVQATYRGGEKKHEILLSVNEMEMVEESETHFIRYPSHDLFPAQRHGGYKKLTPEYKDSGYTSAIAPGLSDDEIKAMLQEYRLCTKPLFAK